MHARLAVLTVGPGMRSTMEKIADEMAAHYRALKGFQSVTFLGDNDTNQYGTVSLWETKEDAEAVDAALGPALREKAGDILKGPPEVRFFEVYEPKD